MKRLVSTVTIKGQVTIPEVARASLGLEPGRRIAWEVRGDEIVGRRLRKLSELAGCLKSDGPPATKSDIRKAAEDAAVARHIRIASQS